MDHAHALPIPPNALADDSALELARIWAANGRQEVTLATGLWDDPAAWGMMLVDLARHVAIAYEAAGYMRKGAALKRIKAGFDAEWGHPTDKPKGGLAH
jgi:hypothetical protein